MSRSTRIDGSTDAADHPTYDRSRVSRALVFADERVSVLELTRTGPAEHDDGLAQEVERATMLLTRDGCATLTRAGRHARRVVADPARVVFLRPGDAYRVHYPSSSGYRATVMTFADDLAPGARDAIAASGPLLLRLHACRKALLASADAHLHAEMEAASRTVAALATTSDAHASTPAHRDLAERACAMLAAAPGDAHRLPAVARALGVSPFFLARVFRVQVGVPVHQYLLRLRLGAALERLAGGERNLSALAVSLGFATHSHFTATFTRTYGATPRAVRETLSASR